MFNLPHYKKIVQKIDQAILVFSAKISHKKIALGINLALVLIVGLLTPTHHAHALPLLVPFIWVAAGSIAAYVGKDVILDKISDALMDALVGICQLIFTLAGMFMTSMGGILDLSIMFTINSDIYKEVSAIQVGWTAVRDLSNMFFIFVLLFIAIKTILGMGGSNTKRWVANLIIAAVLINFSLFFTQVVVDAGNVLAVGFWNKISVPAGGTAGSSATAFFMEGFRIQTNFDTLKDNNGNTVFKNAKDKQAMIYIGGAFVQFVAGYVFLAGAIMMIIRSVYLMILMIASPFAFLGFALPSGGGFASEWLGKLIGTTFMAPAFIFMLYIDSLIIRGAEVMKVVGAEKSSLALAFGGVASNFPIIYNFILMIILLLAALTVAHKVGGGVGASSEKWAKAAIGAGGGAAIAGAAWGGRKTIGKASNSLKNNEKIQNAATQTGVRGAMARAVIRTSNVGAKASFDLRGAPGAGLMKNTGVSFGSAGGAGGYRSQRAAKDKEIIAKAEELFPGNPVAQQNYIRNATREAPSLDAVKFQAPLKKDEVTGKWGINKDMVTQNLYVKDPITGKMVLNEKGSQTANLMANGVAGGGLPSRLEQSPGKFATKEEKLLKDKQEALNRETVVFASKKAIDEHTKEMEGKDEASRATYLNTDVAQKDAAGNELKDANNQVITKKVSEILAESIGKLSAKEVSELSEKVLANSEVQKNLNNTHLAAINGKAGEFKDQNLVPLMTKNILDNGSESGKKYMRAQVSGGASNFRYDYKKELQEQITKRDAAIATQNVAEQAAAEAEISTVIGRVDPQDIAGLDENLLTHDAVTKNLKTAHVSAVQKRSDMDDAFVANFHAVMDKPHVDAKAKNLMKKSLTNNQSGLFNAGVAQNRLDEIDRPNSGALAAATTSAALDPANGTKQALVKQIQQERAALQKALA